MADTQADLTKALRFAIQLAEAEGYPECAAGLRVALDRLAQPPDTQADLTERARAVRESAWEVAHKRSLSRGIEEHELRKAVDEAIAAALQSEREAAVRHLGDVLYGFSDLHPEWRSRAFNEALQFYNNAAPDAQVEPSGLGWQRLLGDAEIEAAAAEARRAAIEECWRWVWQYDHDLGGCLRDALASPQEDKR